MDGAALGFAKGDVLNPTHRFLRAIVAQELGRLDEAKRSLEQALYLDQDFVMAHFALGNLTKRIGRHEKRICDVSLGATSSHPLSTSAAWRFSTTRAACSAVKYMRTFRHSTTSMAFVLFSREG